VFSQLEQLKNFLEDRPSWAFLALSLAANLALFRLLLKAKDKQLALVVQWLPLADKMTTLVTAAATRARTKNLTNPSGGE